MSYISFLTINVHLKKSQIKSRNVMIIFYIVLITLPIIIFSDIASLNIYCNSFFTFLSEHSFGKVWTQPAVIMPYTEWCNTIHKQVDIIVVLFN